MKNQVIEVLNGEHGAKVLKYWQDKGVKTTGYFANQTKDTKDSCRYYGVIDGYFSNYDIMRVNGRCAEIIHLPEERTFPRVMMVGDNENCINTRRVVIAYKCNKYIAWADASTFEEAEESKSVVSWTYAKEIDEPKTVELTVLQLLDKTSEIKKILGIGESDELIIKM